MYRDAAYSERCMACEQGTAERCARCGHPFCDWHLFTDDRVCEGCEARWQSVEEGRGRRLSSAGPALFLAVAGIISAATGYRSIGYALALAAALFYGALAVHRRSSRRRVFLKSRRGTARASRGPAS